MPEQEQPVEPQHREFMNVFAKVLDEELNGELLGKDRKFGFALFVFPFGQGDDHRSNYISNASREDMLATLKEFIARSEGRHQEAPVARQ